MFYEIKYIYGMLVVMSKYLPKTKVSIVFL